MPRRFTKRSPSSPSSPSLLFPRACVHHDASRCPPVPSLLPCLLSFLWHFSGHLYGRVPPLGLSCMPVPFPKSLEIHGDLLPSLRHITGVVFSANQPHVYIVMDPSTSQRNSNEKCWTSHVTCVSPYFALSHDSFENDSHIGISIFLNIGEGRRGT